MKTITPALAAEAMEKLNALRDAIAGGERAIAEGRVTNEDRRIVADAKRELARHEAKLRRARIETGGN